MIVNLSSMDQHVDIVLEDGTKSSVTIMPKAKVRLPKGAKVCNNWQALNANTVRDLNAKKPKE